MTLSRALTCTLCLTASSVSFANTFQYEISGSYSELREEQLVPNSGFSPLPFSSFGPIELTTQTVETDSKGIAGSYFFSPVDTSRGPLAEAAFLDRASSITLNYSDARNIDTLGISGLYINKEHGWIIGASFSQQDLPFGFGSADRKSLSVGYYVATNTTITLDWIDNDNLFSLADEEYIARVRHFGEFISGLNYSVSGFFGTADGNNVDSSDTYGITAIVYPNRRLSFGVGYTDAEIKLATFSSVIPDDSLIFSGIDVAFNPTAPFDTATFSPIQITNRIENSTYGVFTRWFFNEMSSITLAYDRSNRKSRSFISGNTEGVGVGTLNSLNPETDGDLWSINVNLRF
ncbi:putative porin [bacterium SCSIO 12696]|nr:putative porin [bacterium SCSIO 12696]